MRKLDQQKETKIVEYEKYQQGDVVMFKLSDEDFKDYSNLDSPNQGDYEVRHYLGGKNEKAILAFGEVTGHTHRIDMSKLVKSAEVNLHMGYKDEPGIDVPNAFEVRGESVQLQHEEHDTITLPPGNYVVHIVREFNPLTRRAQYVAD